MNAPYVVRTTIEHGRAEIVVTVTVPADVAAAAVDLRDVPKHVAAAANQLAIALPELLEPEMPF